jgi:hypothetical protein
MIAFRFAPLAGAPYEGSFNGKNAAFVDRLTLDPERALVNIPGHGRMGAMDQSSSLAGRRINWISVLTVISAAILISAEVFGAAFAGGWAVANLLGLTQYHIPLGSVVVDGTHVMQGIFFILGIMIMVSFVRNAQRVEPFTTAG